MAFDSVDSNLGTILANNRSVKNQTSSALGQILAAPFQARAVRNEQNNNKRREFLSTILNLSDRGVSNPVNAARQLTGFEEPLNLGSTGIIREFEDIAGAKKQEKQLGAQKTLLDLQKTQAETRITEAEANQVGNLLPKEAFKQQSSLRKEFTNLSKDFIAQRDSYARVVASAKNPSAAGDLALIFNYMKILDPGSVVRESEFATAQNAPGVPDRVRAQYNRILRGERFTPASRQDFVSRASDLFAVAGKHQEQRVSIFEGLANRAGLNPQDIVVNFGLADGIEATPGDNSQVAPSFQGEATNEVLNNEQKLGERSNYKIGEKIKTDFGNLVIVGFDLDGEPLVEEEKRLPEINVL